MIYLNKKYKLQEILLRVKGNFDVVNDNENFQFDNIAPLSEANETSVTFIGNEKLNKLELLKSTKAGAVILCLDTLEFKDLNENKVFVNTNSPRTIFSRLVKVLFQGPKFKKNSSETKTISPLAKIGSGTIIDHGVYIGKSVIGKNCSFGMNVIILDECEIGDNVHVGPNCIIGSTALSIIQNEQQSEKDSFPQLGNVTIESNVRIESFSTIQRGTFGSTVIRENAIIDSYVQIAHNVEIGRNTIIIGHSKISGGVIIGDDVYIGQSVTVGNINKIGSEAFVCMGSVVFRDVPSKSKVFGNPASKVVSPK